MTTGKTISLTRRTFVGKVMSLLFNMLSRLIITFLPRSKHLLISWLQSPTSRAPPNSCPSSRWCHPTISSSVIPFSSCLQSFPASGSFQMSQLFASGGQRIGVSASISVLPMNTQDWSPLGWTDWISLQSKGLSNTWLWAWHRLSALHIWTHFMLMTVQWGKYHDCPYVIDGEAKNQRD